MDVVRSWGLKESSASILGAFHPMHQWSRYDEQSACSARESCVHLARKWQRLKILETVFDQLSDALFLYDKDLHIVGVNQAAQWLFGACPVST
jgi:hypothetical protein